MNNRCKNCYGSGKLLGGGFIDIVCESCHGKGHIKIDSNEDRVTNSSAGNLALSSAVKIDKRSKEYKKAIADLVEKGLSEKEAKKIFDQEMERLDGKDKDDELR